jgi:hypothetical protein
VSHTREYILLQWPFTQLLVLKFSLAFDASDP